MQSSELASRLQEDAARGVPPFGAESVGMARRLGPAAVDLLLEHIADGGATAFLALEALREASPDAYGVLPARRRVEIYVAALQDSVFYNAWGVPGYHLTATAHALVALGDEAVLALKPLLEDRRPAPLSGSQDATTSRMYNNRVCDYAWVFINEIMGRPYRYLLDPLERDREIEQLWQHLASEAA